MLGRLFSLSLLLSGEFEEEGGREEDFGVEERERDREMLLAPLESVVRVDRATERRLLVSGSGLVDDSRGTDVGLV